MFYTQKNTRYIGLYSYIHPSTHLTFLCPSVHPSVRPSIYLSIHSSNKSTKRTIYFSYSLPVSVCLLKHLFMPSSNHLYIHRNIHPPIELHIHPIKYSYIHRFIHSTSANQSTNFPSIILSNQLTFHP